MSPSLINVDCTSSSNPAEPAAGFNNPLVLGCRQLSLGSIALVPPAEVWEKALANRELALSGGDPLAEKQSTEVNAVDYNGNPSIQVTHSVHHATVIPCSNRCDIER